MGGGQKNSFLGTDSDKTRCKLRRATRWSPLRGTQGAPGCLGFRSREKALSRGGGGQKRRQKKRGRFLTPLVDHSFPRVLQARRLDLTPHLTIGSGSQSARPSSTRAQGFPTVLGVRTQKVGAPARLIGFGMALCAFRAFWHRCGVVGTRTKQQHCPLSRDCDTHASPRGHDCGRDVGSSHWISGVHIVHASPVGHSLSTPFCRFLSGMGVICCGRSCR